MITIKSSTLKALLITASKDKTHHRLHGVHFCRRADDVLYASTDGKKANDRYGTTARGN
jgi:hypothetical protein